MARRALYDYLYPAAPQELERDLESLFVFTSQRAAWLRQQGCPDHLSTRGIEHLWMQFKRQGTSEEWKLIAVYAGHQTKDGTPAIATTDRYTIPSRKQLKERIQLLQG